MEYKKILEKEYTLHNFEIMLKITLDKEDTIDKDSKIIKDKYIFLYNYPNIIKIYDCIKFKRIALLKLPITPVKYKIIDINHILIYARNKLYCYSINVLESKLIFKFIISDIFLFTYLQEKNEILIITQNYKEFARINLEGEIKFKQKNEININFDEKEVEKSRHIKDDDDDDFVEDAYIPSGYYNFLYGFNNDKYIFKYFGYCLSSGDPYDNYSEEYYEIQIFNIENMKEIISDECSIYCSCKKLTDTLFIDEDGNQPIIYYDEKENKIKYLDDFFKNCKYFSLDNKSKIGLFQSGILYLIDFMKETKKSIKLNQSYEISNVLDMGYYCEKGNEYLFLLIRNKNFICEIIKGKII